MLLSVIIPSFNSAKYIGDTLRSIEGQSLENVEILLIDGGSTDGTLEIVDSYRHILSQILIEPDGGQADAINKGLRLARGDYVAWQNSDDIYMPNAFRDFKVAVLNFPGVDVFYGDQILIDENGDEFYRKYFVNFGLYDLIYKGFTLTNQAAIFRRASIVELGYWLDVNLHFAMDYEFYLRYFTRPRNTVLIEKALGALRYHPDTKTSRLMDVAAREMTLIRSQYVSGYRQDIDWSRQFLIKRTWASLRRQWFLLLRGCYYDVLVQNLLWRVKKGNEASSCGRV
jgi:glycosyltransferase involved in cell wall biosynthesis